MLAKPEKTRQLIATLRAVLSFEVTPTPELVAKYARQQDLLSSNQ